MVFKFFVPGTPVGKARARTVNNGGKVHSFTPLKTKAYEDFIQNCFVLSGGKIFSGPIKLEVRAIFSVPKSFSKKKRRIFLERFSPYLHKPDGDNILKCVCDALNGVAWEDDREIFSMFIVKSYGEEEGIHVKIFSEDKTDGPETEI